MLIFTLTHTVLLQHALTYVWAVSILGILQPRGTLKSILSRTLNSNAAPHTGAYLVAESNLLRTTHDEYYSTYSIQSPPSLPLGCGCLADVVAGIVFHFRNI
jgi:hypothetical protein